MGWLEWVGYGLVWAVSTIYIARRLLVGRENDLPNHPLDNGDRGFALTIAALLSSVWPVTLSLFVVGRLVIASGLLRTPAEAAKMREDRLDKEIAQAVEVLRAYERQASEFGLPVIKFPSRGDR
jgi:hypothetical protein